MATTDGIEVVSRVRKQTEKGLEYNLQVKRKRIEQIVKALDKVSDACTEIIDSDGTAEALRGKHKHWVKLYDELLSVDNEYRKLMSDTEVDEYHENWYKPRHTEITNYKAKLEDWFTSKAIEVPQESEYEHSVSSLHIRHAFKTPSVMSGASVISERVAYQIKKAELAVKQAGLRRKQELEENKFRLQLMEEKMNLQEEIDINDAHKQVIEEIDQHVIMEQSSPIHTIIHSMNAESLSSDDNESRRRKRDTHSDDAILSLAKHLSMPTADLKPFSGNPLEYQQFKRQFQTIIVKNCDSDDEMINYLVQYTTDEPHKLVKGYSFMDATKGYKAAFKEMDERYGDNEIIVHAFIKKALNWPNIKNDSPKDLDAFSIFLAECKYAVEDLDSLQILEYSENFKRIISKLPYSMHDKWRSRVQVKRDHGEKVKFEDLVRFVKSESKKANDPVFGKEALKSEQPTARWDKSKSRPKGSFATNVDNIEKPTNLAIEKPKQPMQKSSEITTASSKLSAFSLPCCYCRGSHTMESCRSLGTLPFLDRTDYLKGNGFCYGCLRYGHLRRYCKNKSICRICQGHHPSVLHFDGPIPTRNQHSYDDSTTPQVHNTVANSSTDIPQQNDQPDGRDNTTCTMAIVPVKVRIKGSNSAVCTYAFIDQGSNISFCTDRLMHQLGIEGKRMKLTMNTMGKPYTMTTYEVHGLEVISLDERNVIPMPNMYTKDRMPVSTNHIPTSADLQRWPHLADIKIPQLQAEVGILIGNNVPDICAPIEVRLGPRGSPYAVRSVIGWIPWNIMRKGSNSAISVNRADVVAIEQLCDIRDLNELYVKSIGLEYPERTIDDSREYSREDHLFIEKMSASQRVVNGHYEYELPFRDSNPCLPDNEYLARQRLSSLKRKLMQNPSFYKDYSVFMTQLFDAGHAEQVPDMEMDRTDGKTWFIPHHGVYNPNKPNKIRVVFDCSSRCKGISLNSMLLQGPDLINSLLGILLRFRQDHVAVVGDIEKMFYQVKVAYQDRDYMRFFWWKNGDLEAQPAVYRMTVHLFGAVSSPSVSNFALRQTIDDYGDLFQPTVGEQARSSFYVDDFLCATSSDDKAIELVQGLSALCLKGGFRITKWLSNSRTVLENVSSADRATEVADLNLETFPTGRALGVTWNVDKDLLGFTVQAKVTSPTRRCILSTLSSIFDPLGIAAPFILPGKQLLQELCRRGVDWDTELSTSDTDQWNQLIHELSELKKVRVPRCIKPSVTFGKVIQIQLHHFSDASDKGYGTATYIRFLNDLGSSFCNLLFAKARVAPLKKITTPRMELTAAQLAVKINHLLMQQLNLNIDETYFWTDSITVLRYIHNTRSRFHTFVANRLQIIHEGSNVNQWKFVDGVNNPADLASRGLRIGDKKKTEIWLKGPIFLREPNAEWPVNPDINSASLTEDPEIKKSTCATAVICDTSLLDDMIARFSDVMKLKRTLAWVLHFIKCLKSHRTRRQSKRIKATLPTTCMPSVKDLDNAEIILIKHVQGRHLGEEVTRLTDVKLQEKAPGVKTSSAIYKLDPFVSENVIRVGGRLSNSSLPYDVKHQILLPRESSLTHLILSDIHHRIGHLGKNAMLADLRLKYWIPQAGHLIKRTISKCVDCRRYSARPQVQKMADLPSDRIESDIAAFTYVGMDYFGPLEVKRGRTTHKRYGVIFTCCSSRAIHLEVAHSLTTDSCINAIRRFVSRRGPVACIRSDNGTNLVGAEAEMREQIASWNQSRIGRTLQQHHIDWKFNPPSASHFGGIWERLIRLVRRVLYSLLRDQSISLDDESLHTVMCEVEQIVNNRPLTPSSDNPNDLDMLTPNHLLLGRRNTNMPPGMFTPEDKYVKRRWRQIQHIANVFWSRWSKEYIPLLQERQKWLKSSRSIAVGDIVLITASSPRNTWLMGRVTEVHPDRKGLVRVVTLKTQNGVLTRPIHKLCLLLEADENVEQSN